MHNNPIILTDPTGMSADSTRIYNTIGEYQFTINDNLANEDHFMSQENLNLMCNTPCGNVDEEGQMYRDESEFFIGVNTRNQLQSLQGSTSLEEGFLLYPDENGELHVHDVTEAGYNTPYDWKFNPADVKDFVNKTIYNLSIAGGHTHNGSSTASFPFSLTAQNQRDWSPMLISNVSLPKHLLIIVGSNDFNIYSSSGKSNYNIISNKYSISPSSGTSTQLKYNGNSKK